MVLTINQKNANKTLHALLKNGGLNQILKRQTPRFHHPMNTQS
jgi:hypothetical protein